MTSESTSPGPGRRPGRGPASTSGPASGSGSGWQGRATRSEACRFFEVTHDGRATVWQLALPVARHGFDNDCFRAYRYSADYAGLAGI